MKVKKFVYHGVFSQIFGREEEIVLEHHQERPETDLSNESATVWREVYCTVGKPTKNGKT